MSRIWCPGSGVPDLGSRIWGPGPFWVGSLQKEVRSQNCPTLQYKSGVTRLKVVGGVAAIRTWPLFWLAPYVKQLYCFGVQGYCLACLTYCLIIQCYAISLARDQDWISLFNVRLAYLRQFKKCLLRRWWCRRLGRVRSELWRLRDRAFPVGRGTVGPGWCSRGRFDYWCSFGVSQNIFLL